MQAEHSTATASPAAAAAAAAAGIDVEGKSVAQLLRSFLQVQEERARLYARFKVGHKKFLETKQEGLFKSLMAETTAAFQQASLKVKALEGALSQASEEGGVGKPELAALLRRVQEGEREKLRLTLSLQALRQAAAFSSFSWQQKESKNLSPEQLQQPAHGHGSCAHGHGGASCKHGMAPCVDAGSSCDMNGGSSVGEQGGTDQHADHAHGHACRGHAHGHGHTCDHDLGDPESLTGLDEPSEAEYDAAVKEALLLLDGCVNTINEALEEVREALEELEDT